jgi:hypothetical protein
MKRALIAALLLTGCATKEGGWEKSGATNENWHMDRGACIAQMESVPGAGTMQKASVFAGCMQGKGWYWIER